MFSVTYDNTANRFLIMNLNRIATTPPPKLSPQFLPLVEGMEQVAEDNGIDPFGE